MKVSTTIFLYFFISFSFAQTNTLYFEKNKADLTPKSIYQLNELAKQLQVKENFGDIAIIGHTDTDASEGYNQKLALERARSVKKFFMEKSLCNRLHLLSKGEKNTVNQNLTEEQKRLNRRVEIVLNYSNGDIEGVHQFTHLNSNLFGFFEQEKQVFTIDPKRDTVIKTKHGIEVDINKGIFKRVGYNQAVEIHITEYYDKSSFILGNMTTRTSNNGILESRGMINISALQNDDSLKLGQDQKINIFFPDRNLNDGTNIFVGSQQKNEIIWKQMSDDGQERQAGGHTAWYEEGKPFVERDRWWYEMRGTDPYKFSSNEKKGKIKIDSVLIEEEEYKQVLTLSSSTLGWINCDRFVNLKVERTDVLVSYDGEIEPSVYLVFKDFNGMMPYTSRENEVFVFDNIPIDLEATVVGVYRLADSEDIYYAEKPISTNKLASANLRFTKISKTEFEEKLNQL